ncbi:MAG: M20/M25/M40 family metallo-hydrolase [Planctomycetota bacterium]
MPLTPAENTLCTAIRARDKELRAMLADHVAIPTGRSHRPGLDAYIGRLRPRLLALGATESTASGIDRPGWLTLPDAGPPVDQPSPDVHIFNRIRGDGPRVLIAGHLDTVHDPFGPFQKVTADADGTRAVGPGVVDMKGGIVVAIAALEALHAHDVSCDWTVVFNADEETGSFGSAAVLEQLAANHDIGIALEPALADGGLAVERMGAGQFKIEVFGRSAHVGRSFTEGISAVNALADVLRVVADIAAPSDGRIVSVGPIQGGLVTNAVPDYAAAWGNMRFRDEAAGEEIIRRLDALQTAPDAMPHVVVHHIRNRPAKPLIPTVQRYAERVRAAAEDTGQALPFASTGGVCDGNILQHAGLPTLDTLGVRGGNLHRPDEWIDLTSLVDRAQMLAVLLSRLSALPAAEIGRGQATQDATM